MTVTYGKTVLQVMQAALSQRWVDCTRDAMPLIDPGVASLDCHIKNPSAKSKLVSVKDAIALNRGRELPKDYWNILP